MASLSLRNIYKVYPGDVVAVSDFNLEIEDKEFIVLVGPSGCGKSTTLRMVAGLEEITKGELYIDDKLVNNVPPKDRDIAMVFQSYALYPHMTVYNNMAFGLKLRKMPKEEIDRRVKDAAQILGIEGLLNRKPAALSGGQRQRVALGRAIVREPKVFLMDEPLSNLDAKLRVQTRSEITKLHKRLQTTFIYVTHDQTEAMTMADHIVLMKDGHIMQQGTPNDLYDHPANEFVAGFLGTPQINIFPCDVKREDGGLVLDAGAFRLRAPENLVDCLAPYAGKKVNLGIRPSDFELVAAGAGDISAHVDSIEPLGDAYLIYVRVGEKVVVFKYAGETAPVEKELALTPNMAKLHLFDPETEARINN